jgi:predicted alpha/beta hydrolase family esterase
VRSPTWSSPARWCSASRPCKPPMSNTSTAPRVLLLPGWLNSGPEHWQSRWEALHGDQRVEQDDWQWPRRRASVDPPGRAAAGGERPAFLVARLGCWWRPGRLTRVTDRVIGALLAPPDTGEPGHAAPASRRPSRAPPCLLPLRRHQRRPLLRAGASRRGPAMAEVTSTAWPHQWRIGSRRLAKGAHAGSPGPHEPHHPLSRPIIMVTKNPKDSASALKLLGPRWAARPPRPSGTDAPPRCNCMPCSQQVPARTAWTGGSLYELASIRGAGHRPSPSCAAAGRTARMPAGQAPSRGRATRSSPASAAGQPSWPVSIVPVLVRGCREAAAMALINISGRLNPLEEAKACNA